MQRKHLSKIISKTAIEFYWTATRAIGLGRIHGREREVFIELLVQASITPFYPIFFIVAAILKLTPWRFIEAPPFALAAIGHLALDFDCFFKEQILENKHYKYILVGHTNCRIANQALFNMWAPRMTVVKNKLILFLGKWLLTWFPSLKEPILDYCHLVRGPARSHLIQKQWGNRPPLLKLSETDIARGEARLREMGVPPGAWFVCVHVREGGYAPKNEWASSYRNCDIFTYVPAMQRIVESGGWCIRCGDDTMRPLPSIHGVVDYALSTYKADWMDLYLCSQCLFFLGTSSGLYNVAGVFGRPSALANQAPISSISPFLFDLNITKLFADENGRIIPFEELFASELSEFRYTYEFENAKVFIINNTAEEILELTVEMLNRLDVGLFAVQNNNELQLTFRSLVKRNHLCWHGTSSQVARSFLERHRDLLPTSVDLHKDIFLVKADNTALL